MVAFCKLSLIVCTLLLFVVHADEHPSHSLTSKTNRKLVCTEKERDELLRMWGLVNRGKKLSAKELDTLQSLIQRIEEGCVPKDIHKDLQATLRWYGIMPCDLKKAKDLKVILSGEIHQGLSTGGPNYYRKAEEGKLLLGYETGVGQVEGLEYPEHPNVFNGLDKGIGRDLIVTFRSIIQSRRKINLDAFVGLLFHSETLRSVFLNKVVDQYPSESPQRKLGNFIKELFSIKDRERMYTFYNEKKDQLNKLVDSKNILGVIAIIFHELLKEASKKEVMLRELYQIDFEKFKDIENIQFSELLKATDHLREKMMVVRTMELLCTAVDRKLNTVVLHQGAGHLEGVYKELHNFLKQDGLEKTVKILIDPAFLESEDFIGYNQKGGGKDIVSFLNSLPDSVFTKSPNPYFTTVFSDAHRKSYGLSFFDKFKSVPPQFSDEVRKKSVQRLQELTKGIQGTDYDESVPLEKRKEIYELIQKYLGLDKKGYVFIKIAPHIYETKKVFPDKTSTDDVLMLSLDVGGSPHPNAILILGKPTRGPDRKTAYEPIIELKASPELFEALKLDSKK